MSRWRRGSAIVFRLLPFLVAFLRDRRRWILLGPSRKLTVEQHALRARRLVDAIAGLQDIEEANIGHSIIARAALVGLDAAVREMATLLRHPRRLPTVGK